MSNYPKRLIEVDLPIRRISAHARREKSIRHGHISTLHIWWARRPLAACRAVLCAALWPDPADEHCPQSFRETAARLMNKFAFTAAEQRSVADLCHSYTWGKLSALRQPDGQLDPTNSDHLNFLRYLLLDFIADFSNWDASTESHYLETARALTQAAHEALGGLPGTRPLVVDPFAGGGAIPLEALRIGADAFASDLNPVAVLLNKVVLEYIPKYGQRLADEVRKWGEWVKEQAEKELAEFYPPDADGAVPIAYLWARTITCEGPGCGAEVPLIKTCLLDSKRAQGKVYLSIRADSQKQIIHTAVKYGIPSSDEANPTTRGWSVTCPLCGYTTPKKQVQKQIAQQRGGTSNLSLLSVVLSHPNVTGKVFRDPHQGDHTIVASAVETIEQSPYEEALTSLLVRLPGKDAHRAVGSQLPLYGFEEYKDLYTARQKLALACLTKAIEQLPVAHSELGTVVRDLMAICLAKQADYSTSLCRWRHDGAYVNPTLGGEKKYAMVSDFAESCPLSHGSGNWLGQVDWVARVLEREASQTICIGQAVQSSSDQHVLPDDSAAAFVTDPPYYDSVPYSDLANFYYVWLRPLLQEFHPHLFREQLTPKEEEMTVDHPNSDEEKRSYREGLTRAFGVGRLITQPAGMGTIVFAHKSTSGWEALLAAIIGAGWCIVASWPVDTELQNRLNALGTASLASSVHLVCRPRENPDGSLCTDAIGEWRDVLNELPGRIHEWMPRLAQEGIVGADAIFACLGPALEIYSRYSRVERADGTPVPLGDVTDETGDVVERGYLSYVWEAVSREALSMIFEGADTAGFEADARLTAMWLWTLSTAADDVERSANDKVIKSTGYTLEYDAARKIAQGLGAHLERMGTLVQVKGDKARLLPVGERTRALFGKEGPSARRRRKSEAQLSFLDEVGVIEEKDTVEELGAAPHGTTVLDRVHQAMLLFASGRSEALRRFLVEEGVGQEARFWRLAQALSALYPPQTDEKRWVDGVLARKKGLGF